MEYLAVMGFMFSAIAFVFGCYRIIDFFAGLARMQEKQINLLVEICGSQRAMLKYLEQIGDRFATEIDKS